MTVASSSGAPGRTVAEKAVGYLQLSKIRIYHHAYGWLLAFLLLRLDGLVGRSTAAALTLTLVMVLTTQWSGGAADDLGGFRDGSDARNYAGRPARTVSKKPLLTGVLTESEAVRFGLVTGAVALVSGLLGAYATGGRAPLVAVAIMLVAQICSVQYSIGLKLSYLPAGLEVTIFFVIGCITLLPYWLIAGKVTPEVLLTSALVGTWFLLIVSYGNASDREGDREVSRKTLAVVLPPTLFKGFLVFLFLASAVLLAMLFTLTRFSPVLAFTVIPVVVLHSVQLYFGVGKNDWRKARFIGLSSVDAGCLGLALAFLLH